MQIMKNKNKLYTLTIAIAIASSTLAQAEAYNPIQKCLANCDEAFGINYQTRIDNDEDESAVLAEEQLKLVSCNADCNKSLVQLAKENNFTGVEEYLTQNSGFDINELDPTEQKSSLTYAFLNKNPKMVESLLNKAALCNNTKAFIPQIVNSFIGQEGDDYKDCPNTGLHQEIVNKFAKACESNNKELLIEEFNFLVNGADIVAKEGNDKLFTAIENQSKDMVEYLLCAGVNPNVLKSSDDQKTTPLHLVCEKGNLEISKILIEKGASLEAINANGERPLHIAAKNLYSDLTAYLVADKKDADGNIVILGANTMVRNNDGKYPIALARESLPSAFEEREDFHFIDEQAKTIDTIRPCLVRDAGRNARAELAK